MRAHRGRYVPGGTGLMNLWTRVNVEHITFSSGQGTHVPGGNVVVQLFE